MIPAQGFRKWNSQTSYFHRGTSPYTIWYAGCQNQTAFTTGSPALNFFLAYSFTLSRPAILSKLSFEVTTDGAAGSKGRAGIYRATSLGNQYPAGLVVDGGEHDCTTIGVKTTSSLTVAMSAGEYWLVSHFGTAAPVCRIQSGIGNNPSVLGTDSTLASLNSGWQLSRAYAALPSTFTAGATRASTGLNMPIVALELSA